jgi:hypothetical protein
MTGRQQDKTLRELRRNLIREDYNLPLCMSFFEIADSLSRITQRV